MPELPRLVGRLAVPTLLLMPLGLIGLEQAIFLQVPFVVTALCAVRILAYAGLRLGRRAGHLKIHVVPRFFDIGMASTGTGTDQIWGIPLCRVRRSVLHSAAWRTKR